MVSEEQKLEILRLEKTGLSQGKIAKILGVTKNTVSGQLNRIKARGGLLKLPSKAKHRAKIAKVKNIINLDMPITNDGVTIFELKYASCRYMIGNHKYCGHNQYKRSYCEKHFKECHQWERKKK